MDPAKRKQEEIQIRKLTEMMRSNPANEICADCGARGCRWCSINLGAFLCIRCGGIHRSLGTHISKIKSLSLDIWPPETLEVFLTLGGNEAVNAKYLPNPSLVPPPPVSDDLRMEQYIRDKYERKKFMTPGAAGASEERYRTRDLPAPPASAPRPTVSAERDLRDKYRTHLAKLSDMGFTDETLNIKLLSKFAGSVNETIDYLLNNPQEQRRAAPTNAPSQTNRARPAQTPAPAPAPSQKKEETMDDIFGAFMSAPSPAGSSQAPQPQPAPVAALATPSTDARKAQILALYNQPAPRPAMMVQPTTQQPAQPGFGQPQQQTNPFATNWGGQPAQPGAWQQPAQQQQAFGGASSWSEPPAQQADPFAAFGSFTSSMPSQYGQQSANNNNDNNPFF